MTGIGEPLIVLNDREPVPEGSVTFGQLVLEAFEEIEAEEAVNEDEKRHVQLYSRWIRRFGPKLVRGFELPPDHPILSEMRWWEMYVCRFFHLRGDESFIGWFFDETNADERRALCNFTRAQR